jgi:hypothetical protein
MDAEIDDQIRPYTNGIAITNLAAGRCIVEGGFSLFCQPWSLPLHPAALSSREVRPFK